MLGIVGKILVEYNNFQEYIEVTNVINYKLKYLPECIVAIDEVIYVEDTIYGAVILINEDEYYISGDEITEVKYFEHNIKFSLYFGNCN